LIPARQPALKALKNKALILYQENTESSRIPSKDNRESKGIFLAPQRKGCRGVKVSRLLPLKLEPEGILLLIPQRGRAATKEELETADGRG